MDGIGVSLEAPEPPSSTRDSGETHIKMMSTYAANMTAPHRAKMRCTVVSMAFAETPERALEKAKNPLLDHQFKD